VLSGMLTRGLLRIFFVRLCETSFGMPRNRRLSGGLRRLSFYRHCVTIRNKWFLRMPKSEPRGISVQCFTRCCVW
jgi:hypothetical protein